MNIFAIKLQQLLIVKNLKNKELANSIHVSESSVSNWLKGTKVPDLLRIKELADFFNVPFWFFFEDNPNLNLEAYMSIEGLKDDQIKIIKELIECFRRANNGES